MLPLTVYRRRSRTPGIPRRLAGIRIFVSPFSARGAPPFEVASIHPVPGPANFNTGIKIDHGKLTAENATLRQIVAFAYGTQGIRVVGGPPWMSSDLYRIDAKAENPNASREQVLAMLQTLLAQRFQLAVRHETMQLPAYVLTVQKSGPKLKRAEPPGQPSVSLGDSAAGKSGGRPMVFYSMTMDRFAATIGNILGTPVLDQTGLKGAYDFSLELPLEPQSDTGTVVADAIEEQLGLKLDRKLSPLDVLDVEHIEKPSAN